MGNFWWETFINEHYNLGSILASPSFIYFLYIPMQTRESVMKKIILISLLVLFGCNNEKSANKESVFTKKENISVEENCTTYYVGYPHHHIAEPSAVSCEQIFLTSNKENGPTEYKCLFNTKEECLEMDDDSGCIEQEECNE